MKIYRRTTIVEEKEITISIKVEAAKVRSQHPECGSEKDDSQVPEFWPSPNPGMHTPSRNCLTDKTTALKK
jgi:hypothetical protein